MAYEFLEIEDRGAVRVITINRERKLNALNHGVLTDLERAITETDAAASVAAVVLTGKGDKAFIAGADIKELSALDPQGAKEQVRFGQRVFARFASFRCPVVAAINGYALGGGLELALACQLRVAAKTARMGLPEVKLGIIPGYGGTQRLQRIIGSARALELILSGEPIDAERALAWGLVNRIAETPADTVDVALALLEPVLKRGPLAVRAALEANRRGADLPLAEAMRVEADLFALLSATSDMHEGMQAFLDKRHPKFEGR